MRMRALVAGAATAVLIPALAACGSSDKKTDSTPTPTEVSSQTSTQASTPANSSTTATGLNKMVDLAKQIAAANAADGKTLSEGLEGFWKPVEDGVKAKDPSTYTAIEDAMAGLESGDTAKAQRAASDLEAAVKAYLAKNPA